MSAGMVASSSDKQSKDPCSIGFATLSEAKTTTGKSWDAGEGAEGTSFLLHFI